MLCHEPSGYFYNRLQYPVIFPSQESRDAVADYLFEQGIDTIKYLDDIIDIATETYGYAADCPVSERLAKRVLIIPNYRGLRQTDVQRITKSLNAMWAQLSGYCAPSVTLSPEINVVGARS